MDRLKESATNVFKNLTKKSSKDHQQSLFDDITHLEKSERELMLDIIGRLTKDLNVNMWEAINSKSPNSKCVVINWERTDRCAHQFLFYHLRKLNVSNVYEMNGISNCKMPYFRMNSGDQNTKEVNKHRFCINPYHYELGILTKSSRKRQCQCSSISTMSESNDPSLPKLVGQVGNTSKNLIPNINWNKEYFDDFKINSATHLFGNEMKNWLEENEELLGKYSITDTDQVFHIHSTTCQSECILYTNPVKTDTIKRQRMVEVNGLSTIEEYLSKFQENNRSKLSHLHILEFAQLIHDKRENRLKITKSNDLISEEDKGTQETKTNEVTTKEKDLTSIHQNDSSLTDNLSSLNLDKDIAHIPCCNNVEFWCSIIFYSKSSASRIEKFGKATQFSIGKEQKGHYNLQRYHSNISRDLIDQIGHGVTIKVEFQRIVLKNNSQFPIYLQSMNLNSLYNLHPFTVCRIEGNDSVDLFSADVFLQNIRYCFNEIKEPYRYLYMMQLAKTCSCRFSFIKGWGSKYTRSHITATEAWIELHFNSPLQLLDCFLPYLPHPCMSTSLSN
ncbi:hypothetical protein SNEBB_009748 [Seison nebaliae]|nr:hypothetical protein SNEBB_009748 [Seison nebaliae]